MIIMFRSSLFRPTASILYHPQPFDIRTLLFSHLSTARLLSTTRTQKKTKTHETTTTTTPAVVQKPPHWERRWQKRYESMKEYCERVRREQNLRPNDYIPYPKSDLVLARWLNRNRRNYQRKMQGLKSSFTNEQQQKLESLGISLWPRKERWDLNYERLCQFVKDKGCFPYDKNPQDLHQEDTRLLHWCKKQREKHRIYKRGKLRDVTSMRPEREEKLNDIGFCWNERDENWMRQYLLLKKYYEHHGNCLVPNEYAADRKLGAWVAEQRFHYNLFQKVRHSGMTAKRLELLNALGFEGDAVEAHWTRKYNELKEHVRLNGLGAVPSYKHDQPLLSWCKYQRKQYQKYLDGEKTSMTKQRKELLDKLGFAW